MAGMKDLQQFVEDVQTEMKRVTWPDREQLRNATAVILVYGILHDGFAVRGVTTSWTVLDQERHEAASVSARTLFAGLAPATLTMPPEVVLPAAAVALGARLTGRTASCC